MENSSDNFVYAIDLVDKTVQQHSMGLVKQFFVSQTNELLFIDFENKLYRFKDRNATLNLSNADFLIQFGDGTIPLNSIIQDKNEVFWVIIEQEDKSFADAIFDRSHASLFQLYRYDANANQLISKKLEDNFWRNSSGLTYSNSKDEVYLTASYWDENNKDRDTHHLFQLVKTNTNELILEDRYALTPPSIDHKDKVLISLETGSFIVISGENNKNERYILNPKNQNYIRTFEQIRIIKYIGFSE